MEVDHFSAQQVEIRSDRPAARQRLTLKRCPRYRRHSPHQASATICRLDIQEPSFVLLGLGGKQGATSLASDR